MAKSRDTQLETKNPGTSAALQAYKEGIQPIFTGPLLKALVKLFFLFVCLFFSFVAFFSSSSARSQQERSLDTDELGYLPCTL